MNVVVSDATGLIKIVQLKTDGTVKKLGTQERARGGITRMAWAGATNPETEVAVALSQGTVEVWNTLTGERTANMQAPPFASPTDSYIGLHVLREFSPSIQSTETTRRMITATRSGVVSIAPWVPYLPDIDENEYIREQERLSKSMSKTQLAQHKKKASNNRAKLLQARDAEYNKSAVQWQAGSALDFIRVDPCQSLLATGGKDNKLALWDIATQQPVWKTRNLPNNWLNLEVPNWDLDCAFISPYNTALNSNDATGLTNASATPNDYKIVTSNGHRYIRLYDPRSGGRPVMKTRLDNEPARSIAISNDQNYVIAGNTAGRVEKLDLRADLQKVGVMRGSCGSIRQISVHPTLNMVASVSLDRHLRIHDLETRKPLKVVYLTQKLTGCLFSSVAPGKRARGTDHVDVEAAAPSRRKTAANSDDEDATGDDVWNRLATHDDAKKQQSNATKQQVDIQDEDDDEDVDDVEDFDEDEDIDDEDVEIFGDEDDDEDNEDIFQDESFLAALRASGLDDEDDEGEGELDFGEGELDLGEGELDLGEGELDLGEGELDLGEGELDNIRDATINHALMQFLGVDGEGEIDENKFAALFQQFCVSGGEGEGEEVFGEGEFGQGELDQEELGEGEFDFGEGEFDFGEGEFDFDEDEDDDEDDEYTTYTGGFTILGANGKPLIQGKSQ